MVEHTTGANDLVAEIAAILDPHSWDITRIDWCACGIKPAGGNMRLHVADLLAQWHRQRTEDAAKRVLTETADAFNTEGISLKPGGWGSNPADQQTIDFAVATVAWLRDRATSLNAKPAETRSTAMPGMVIRNYSGTTHYFDPDEPIVNARATAYCGTKVATWNGHTTSTRLTCKRCAVLAAKARDRG